MPTVSLSLRSPRWAMVFVLLLFCGLVACTKSTTSSEPGSGESTNETTAAVDDGGSNDLSTSSAWPAEEFVLENGLKVYFSRNTAAPEFYAEIIVRSGSKNEPEDATGLAHYLEHMLFKGTNKIGTSDHENESAIHAQIVEKYEEKRAATSEEERARITAEIDQLSLEAAQYFIPGEYDRLLTSLGQTGLNAHTSVEETVYKLKMPKNRFSQWARLQADVFTNPEIARSFQWELEVVYEEKNTRSSAGSQGRAKAFATLFGDHGYGREIIGLTEHLKNPSLKKTIEFFENHYVTGNMAIAISGDLELAEVQQVLQETFGQFPAKPAPAYDPPALPALEGKIVQETPSEQQPSTTLMYRLPGDTGADAEAIIVLGEILSNGQMGLIDELNSTQGLYGAAAGPLLMQEHGVFFVAASVRDDLENEALNNHEGVEAKLLEVLEKVKSGEFSDELLAAVKLNQEKSYLLTAESSSRRVENMRDAFILGVELEDHRARYDRIMAVTKEDVQRVASEYLKDGYVANRIIRGQTPIDQVAKPPITPLTGRTSSASSPFVEEMIAEEVEPLTPVFVDFQKDFERSAEGENSYLRVENPYNDLFELTVEFDFNALTNRKLCAALGLMNLAGSSEFTRIERDQRLYQLGVEELAIDCSKEKSKLSFAGTDRNLPQALELVAQWLRDPKIEDSDRSSILQQVVIQRTNDRVNPRKIVAAGQQHFLFGAEAQPKLLLSGEELQSLTEEDMRAATTRLLQSSYQVYYIGQKPLAEIQNLVQETLPQAESLLSSEKPQALSVAKVSEPTVYFYHRDAMRQAMIRLIYPVEMYQTGRLQDELSDRIFSSYYTNGLGSILFRELREKRSLGYSPSGVYPYRSSWGLQRPGDEMYFIGSLDTQADKLLEAVDSFREVMSELIWEEAPFQAAKASIQSRYESSPIGFRSLPAVYKIWSSQGYEEDPRRARYDLLADTDMATVASRMNSLVSGKAPLIVIVGDQNLLDLDGLRERMTVNVLTEADIFQPAQSEVSEE